LPTSPARFGPQSETRSATQGFALIPNSILENLGAFPPCELYLVLILNRRGTRLVGNSVEEQECTVTDDGIWKAWTGLDRRMKNRAINGLKQKGCLVVSGHGSKATFKFDRNGWENWVKKQPLTERRAKTITRVKPVAAKPKQQIHPECREHGCQKLCEVPSCETQVIPIDSLAKPTPPPSPPSIPPKTPQQKPFESLIGIFLSLGVRISERDVARCRNTWNKLTVAEQATALAYALARNGDDWAKCESRYIPRPWNFLDRKEWERRAPERKRVVKNPFED